MAAYLVVCDLRSTQTTPDELTEKIESLGESFRCLDCVWTLNPDSCSSAYDVFERLRPTIGSEDKLGVFRIRDEWSHQGLSRAFSNWLDENAKEKWFS